VYEHGLLGTEAELGGSGSSNIDDDAVVDGEEQAGSRPTSNTMSQYQETSCSWSHNGTRPLRVVEFLAM